VLDAAHAPNPPPSVNPHDPNEVPIEFCTLADITPAMVSVLLLADLGLQFCLDPLGVVIQRET
jgi:hypothetical protein